MGRRKHDFWYHRLPAAAATKPITDTQSCRYIVCARSRYRLLRMFRHVYYNMMWSALSRGGFDRKYQIRKCQKRRSMVERVGPKGGDRPDEASRLRRFRDSSWLDYIFSTCRKRRLKTAPLLTLPNKYFSAAYRSDDRKSLPPGIRVFRTFSFNRISPLAARIVRKYYNNIKKNQFTYII